MDEFEDNGNTRPSKNTSHFPIPEQVKINEEWKYKYAMEDGTYTTKQPFRNPEELITSSWTGTWTGAEFTIRP